MIKLSLLEDEKIAISNLHLMQNERHNKCMKRPWQAAGTQEEKLETNDEEVTN